MQGIPILFTLWPGLAQLWLQGRWSGLFQALTFAIFLNFVLFATYQQKDLLSKSGLIGCWIVIGVVWTLAIFQNDRVVKSLANSKQDNRKDLDQRFQMAQLEYLRGNMNEAENILERILAINPDDQDVRLYLATIHRHRGRLHQATRQLDLIEIDPKSEKWFFEIEAERQKIAELEQELTRSTQSDNSETGNSGEMTSGEMQKKDNLTETDSPGISPPQTERFAA